MRKATLMLVLMSVLLQGCIPTLVGVGVGGAIAGGIVINDKRSFKTAFEDAKIKFKIHHRLHTDKNLMRNTHIVYAVYSGNVLLAGQVFKPAQRLRAVDIVQTVPRIRKIYDYITISGETTYLARTNDAWITTKIKTEFLATRGLRSGSFKVVTENGVVYLMGNVTHPQARLAASVARRVTGVQRVVLLLNYIKH